MLVRLMLACFVALVAFGCGPKTESSQPPNPEERTTMENSAATHEDRLATGVSASVDHESEVPMTQAATLEALTRAVRKYSAEKRRVPGNLNELVGAGYLQTIPAAPPGKKFVINPKRVEVIVVNQ